MTQQELLDLLQRATPETVYEAMRQTVTWLLTLSYVDRKTAQLARDIIELADARRAEAPLVSVALLLVPPGWSGNLGFGAGLKRAVLFSPTFVAYGVEPPVEAEHELGSIALAIAAILARA